MHKFLKLFTIANISLPIKSCAGGDMYRKLEPVERIGLKIIYEHGGACFALIL